MTSVQVFEGDGLPWSCCRLWVDHHEFKASGYITRNSYSGCYQFQTNSRNRDDITGAHVFARADVDVVIKSWEYNRWTVEIVPV